jgi:hypothetical protein
MKDNAKAKAVLRDLVEKSPTNDGNIWNVISWLLSNAENDAEFRADVARILKVRREYAHWENLRQYPANWSKTAIKSKDDEQKQRGAYLDAEITKADQDQVMRLISEMDGRVNGTNDVRIREQLLKPQVFNLLNTELKRFVLWGQGYYYQHYSPGDERANAVMNYAKLTDLFPKHFDYRYRQLQVATDYGQPEVAREAALSMLSTEPDHNNADVWRRLLIAADKNMDTTLAKRALEWRAKSISKFGPEQTYASAIGDSLTRLDLNAEAVAVWTEAAKPGLNHYECRECAWRLFQKLEDPQQKIAFARTRFAPETDHHGRYAQWLADTQLRIGDLDGFEQTLRETRKRASDRPFKGWEVDAWALHYMLNHYRTSHADYRVDKEQENTPENILRVARVIRDMAFDPGATRAAGG